MVKRALVQRRPWLMVALLFGVSWWFIDGGGMPGTYQIAWKGAGVGALALYAFQRHLKLDGTLIAAAMAFAAMGDMALELMTEVGGALFAISHVFAIWLYQRNRRARLAFSQKLFAIVLMVAVPVITWLLTMGQAGQGLVTVYSVLVAGMAAMAWTSRFPRYRVGFGALLFVLSDLILFASGGAGEGMPLLAKLVWPLYFTGQVMIVTGVVSQLRKERGAVASAEG